MQGPHSKNTQGAQRLMLSYMLTTREGREFFPLLREVEQSVFEDEFSDPALRQVVASLGRFHAAHGSLPSRTAWQQWRTEDAPFIRWRDLLDPSTRQSLKALEEAMHEPSADDAPYIKHKVADAVLRIHMAAQARKDAQAMASGTLTAMQAFEESRASRARFAAAFDAALNGRRVSRFEVTGAVSLDGLDETEGVATIVPNLILQRYGLTVLAAPPKSYKTGVMQAIAVDLARRGYDVLYLDLENGEAKSRRRFYQNMLGCPKEWTWARKWVDESLLPAPLHSREASYSKGAKACKVLVIKEEQEEAGKVVKRWRMEVQVWAALIDQAESVDEWALESILPDDHPAIKDMAQEIEARIALMKGRLHLSYVQGATVEAMEREVEAAMGAVPELGREGMRVLIPDWGRHVRNQNSKLALWERVRDNYGKMKDMRERLDIMQLMVEAPADYEKLYDPHFKALSNLKMTGTSDIGYEVEHLCAMLMTEEEVANGYRRIVTPMARDSASGGHVVEFLKLDYARMQVQVCTMEEHKAANPKYWEAVEGGTRGGGKGQGFKPRMRHPEEAPLPLNMATDD